MAEEVGSGYVSLLPSMRNFSSLVKAELKKELAKVKGQGIEVPVTPKFDQKLLNQALAANKSPLRVPVVFDPVNDPAGRAGAVRVPVEIDKEHFRRSLLSLGNDTRTTVTQHVRVETDKDFVRGQIADAAREGGTTAAGLFSSGFSSSLPLLIAGAVAAAFLSPQIALAAGAAILSGGALASVFLGAFLLRGDKDLQAGVKSLFGDVQKTLTEAAQPLKGPFLEALSIIGKAFKDISPDIKTFFSTIAKSGGIQELARGVGGFIKSFSETGALKKLGESIGPVLKQVGMALPDIGNAFSQLIITVTKPAFIEMVGKILRGVADVIRFIGDAIGWLAGFATAVSDVVTGLGIMVDAIMGAPEALAFLRDALNSVAKWVGEKWRSLWSEAGNKVGTTVSAVVTTVKGIPAKIAGALGNAGTFLVQAGKNIVQGLIDGIKSKFSALSNIASLMAGEIRSFLPFSPAKQGPLSGSGNPYHSGQVIAGDLAAGVRSGLPTVNSAASQLAGQFGFGSSARGAAAPADQPTVLVPGDRAAAVLIELLKEGIRARNGGNVALALGS